MNDSKDSELHFKTNSKELKAFIFKNFSIILSRQESIAKTDYYALVFYWLWIASKQEIFIRCHVVVKCHVVKEDF